jgi:integrase
MMMPLTHTEVNNAKPKDKVYKMFDSGGLHLLVKPTGSKSWKYDYRLNKKRGTYTIGKYPEISLKCARQDHLKARELVAKGVNPKTEKDASKIKATQNAKRFSAYCNEWAKKQSYTESTCSDLIQRLEINIYPYLDKKNVNEFTTADLLKVCTIITDRGARETAKRMAGVLRRVFNEILILGIIENNPAQGLAELLPKPDHRKKKNFGHITNGDELKNLLIQIENPISKRQDPIVTYALRFMPLVFLRPKNIRFLKWSYIDFDNKLITIPANEMKAGKEHQVPLSNQAIKILNDMNKLTSKHDYVFISNHSKKGQPISENTTTQALKRMINPDTNKPYGTGYMTSHGFRHTASTFLNELSYSADAIELQLAHSNNTVRAVYNKAQLMNERTKMMQEWADYLDKLKTTNANSQGSQ